MNYLIRALIAAVGCVVTFALIPPLFGVFGFSASGDLMQVIKICVGGIAIFYVLAGPAVSWPSRSA